MNRSLTSRIAIVGLLGVGVALGPGAFAQDPEPAAKVDPRAEKIVREFAEILNGLKSYRLEFASSAQMNTGGVEMETDTAYRVKRQRPDKIVIASRDEAKGLRLVSDGRNVYTYQAGTNSYAVTEVSDNSGGLKRTLLRVNAISGGGDAGLSMFLAFFLTDDYYEEIMEGVTELHYLGREEIDGAPCHPLR
ncbi:DUF2092 domain-containing protein, partial [Candidatus Sumerlaeota bacterium]|nr:DUF2092 domain-containing protein [Candidatus Sumerlaeota bacterium]